MNRRDALKALGVSALALAGCTKPSRRIVVIGGGFGGATAARSLKRLAPHLEVTLVERDAGYIACPFSNLVIAGLRELDDQQFGYDGLAQSGVRLVHDEAEGVDYAGQTVRLASGAQLAYDRLILAPGIDIKWSALEGYDEEAANLMPHAWKAGAQTSLLAGKLADMADGGRVVITAPAAPYRCPPGPYERASLIAHYLKTHKPRSKLIILDEKETFSKMPLFQDAWRELYGDLLEWRGGASAGGRVLRVAAAAGTVETEFETIHADVANIIPPQKAGAVAERAGVADDTGWCPVNAVSFESTLQPNIHVIGDAIIGGPVPKSAFAANVQGKVCALQVARLEAGLEAAPTSLANTCFSYVSSDAAISVSGIYHTSAQGFTEVEGAGGTTPRDAGAETRQAEAAQAANWFAVITAETFG